MILSNYAPAIKTFLQGRVAARRIDIDYPLALFGSDIPRVAIHHQHRRLNFCSSVYGQVEGLSRRIDKIRFVTILVTDSFVREIKSLLQNRRRRASPYLYKYHAASVVLKCVLTRFDELKREIRI